MNTQFSKEAEACIDSDNVDRLPDKSECCEGLTYLTKEMNLCLRSARSPSTALRYPTAIHWLFLPDQGSSLVELFPLEKTKKQTSEFDFYIFLITMPNTIIGNQNNQV